MIVFPAIDIKGGKCVMLKQGDVNRAAVYDEIPAKMAAKWESMGAAYLHVVDIDGAFTGKPCNVKEINSIVKGVKVPVQLGGGIRDLTVIERMLRLGVHRVILGTAALRDTSLIESAVRLYPGKTVIGIDVKDGLVAAEGWQKTSSTGALEIARQMEHLGVETVIFTDIRRDGMLKGPNFAGIADIIKNTSLNVIASGGISRLEHIKRLSMLGASGAIVGSALYTGKMNLTETLQALGG